MYRAVFVRTLKPGVTDEEFVEAWMPEGLDQATYPAPVTMGRSTADGRQVITVATVDTDDPQQLPDLIARLVHPDSAQRFADLVETTEVEAVFEDSTEFGPAQPLRP